MQKTHTICWINRVGLSSLWSDVSDPHLTHLIGLSHHHRRVAVPQTPSKVMKYIPSAIPLTSTIPSP